MLYVRQRLLHLYYKKNIGILFYLIFLRSLFSYDFKFPIETTILIF